MPGIAVCWIDMDGGDMEVSVLVEVEVVIVAEDVSGIVVGVVVAELALWMVSKSRWAIIVFVPVVIR